MLYASIWILSFLFVHVFGNDNERPKDGRKIPDFENMDQEEMDKFDRNAFTARDLNNNNYIEEDEIFDMMKQGFLDSEIKRLSRNIHDLSKVKEAVAELFSKKEKEMRKKAQSYVLKDDTDKDGRISFQEFSVARRLFFQEAQAKRRASNSEL